MSAILRLLVSSLLKVPLNLFIKAMYLTFGTAILYGVEELGETIKLTFLKQLKNKMKDN